MLQNIYKKCFKPIEYTKLCRYIATNSAPQIEPTKKLKDGPGLKEFLIAGKNLPAPSRSKNLNIIYNELSPYLNEIDLNGNKRKIYFETYGCQMNSNDTEIIWGILSKYDYIKVNSINEANIVLVITCAIREGAETKIFNRLKHLSALKIKQTTKHNAFQIGILGCMAERLKTDLLEKEKLVDVVVGPDSYRDLPRLLAITKNTQQSAVNVLLSLDETYADIMPIRLNQGSPTAFVSVMRGCDNMCSYCIVPFTRGKERSRKSSDIENEVKELENQGIKEITLLGQNVNSYRDLNTESSQNLTNLAKGFKTVYKDKKGGVRFAELLEHLASSAPNIRFRFTSPHPKDFPDDVLHVIKKYPNICKSIHLPAQSGNSAVLDRMRRGYTREAYIELVNNIRSCMPNIALSSDFICGFCGETDEEFSDTISLIEEVKYNVAYLFKYSMREKTTAHRRFKDDIPDLIKSTRLQEMIKSFRDTANELQSNFVSNTELILVEGISKRSPQDLYGRNDANIKVVIPNHLQCGTKINIGDFIAVKINFSNSQILKGIPLYHTCITDFYK